MSGAKPDALLWHITFAGDERQILFPEESERRAAVRAIARITAGVLVLFSVVDEHLHLIVFGTREQAGRLKRAVQLSLQPLTATPIDPGRVRPVNGRSHMDSLVTYLLEQPEHHGIPVHPATYSGSCFPDLVGARSVVGMELRLRDALPRYRLRKAYKVVGLPDVPLEPVSLERVREVGATRLVSASAGAFGVGPVLLGQQAEVIRAKTAAAMIGTAAGISCSDLAFALELSPSGLRRTRYRGSPDTDQQTVLLMLALMEAAMCSPTPGANEK